MLPASFRPHCWHTVLNILISSCEGAREYSQTLLLNQQRVILSTHLGSPSRPQGRLSPSPTVAHSNIDTDLAKRRRSLRGL